VIKGLRVPCAIKNCVYYNPVPGSPNGCICAHKDKGFYLANSTCPLYKAQWDAQAEAALLARFSKKRR